MNKKQQFNKFNNFHNKINKYNNFKNKQNNCKKIIKNKQIKLNNWNKKSKT